MVKKARREKKDEEIEDTEVEEDSTRKSRDRGKDSSVIYKTGQMPKMRGGGIAKKLAFYISATIFLIMLIVAVVMYMMVAGALDKQIDAGGVALVKVFAAPDFESWSQFYGLDTRVLATDEEKEHAKFNRERLRDIIKQPSLLLNARIMDTHYFVKRDAIEIQTGTREPPQFHDLQSAGYRKGEVEVKYGYFQVNERNYSARSYTAPIKDYKGETTGYANVVLSEKQISQRKQEYAGVICILFVVFIGLGIGAAFLVGGKITMPVKALIEDIRIVAEGDLDHHTVPKSQDEIGLLARTFDKMTKNLSEAQAKEIEIAAQKHQMAVAQEVQSKLLPTEIPEIPGYEIKAYHRSSKEVDGNYYDVIRYPDGKAGVLVAAASGKGMPAAIVMSMARSFFRALVNNTDGPAEMLREANRLLSPDLRAGMYVEVLMLLLDPEADKARIVSAGPTSLFRYSHTDKKLQGIQGEGIALGFDKGPVFDKSLKEVEIDIANGDRMVLNTPGLFTIKNPEGVDLGTKGFAKTINKHATKNSEAFVNLVVNILDNYAGKDIDDTDITFVTVRKVS